ncbi:OsmC family protein [uncultured Corynebacterium sp.]|uniref:OsmC family protein n=1 Tax=uncultured Corynebacterium sp. TaxID=159447 RepID=UPI0025CD3F94|nr:OsmC family protein [uncultured Corynebacterium sp.]
MQHSAGARATVNNDPEGFFISVELEVTIPGLNKEDAQALADAAHEACPYSKATRGNIDASVTVAED